jgi:hypothetical protein
MRKDPQTKATPKPPQQFVVPGSPPVNPSDSGTGEDVELHKAIEEERAAALPEADQLKLYRRYARGKQTIKLTDLQKEVVGRIIGNRFCDNVVSMVLETISSRLRFNRFTLGEESGDSAKKALAWLDEVRQKNRWADLANKVHWAMLRDGDCAVCVGWKSGQMPGEGRPLVTREPFWDGQKGVFIAYHDDGQTIKYAVKDWLESDGTVRRTIYYPDRIYRYMKPKIGSDASPSFGATGWIRYADPGDPIYEMDDGQGGTVLTQWPVMWLDQKGQPLGVPFVHFPNPYIPNDGDAGDDDDTDVGKGTTNKAKGGDFHPSYGVAEGANGLIGQQDHLNAVHLDIAVGRKTTASQMYYATGVDGEDDQGNPIAYKPRAGKMLTSDNENAAFGVLPAGDLGALIASVDVTLRAVSRTTKVPMHTFTGDWPSGAAMYQSESGLNFKCERVSESVKPHWGAVGYLCFKLDNTFGTGSWDLNAIVGTEFSPVARLDPLVMAELANSVAGHVSESEYLRLIGYEEADVVRIMAEREADRKKQLDHETAIADAAARRFNRGTLPPNTPPPVPSPPPAA